MSSPSPLRLSRPAAGVRRWDGFRRVLALGLSAAVGGGLTVLQLWVATVIGWPLD